MPGIKGHEYTWNKSWIEFKAPDAPGVYCLRDKEGKVLFVGKGKVRERLLSHWNRENSTDEAIWGRGPASFQRVATVSVVLTVGSSQGEADSSGRSTAPVLGMTRTRDRRHDKARICATRGSH